MIDSVISFSSMSIIPKPCMDNQTYKKINNTLHKNNYIKKSFTY
jgi:hypothetical protein